ncbi:hypothetical protein AAFN47_22245 [Hoeflea sp. CAU 1731]
MSRVSGLVQKKYVGHEAPTLGAGRTKRIHPFPPEFAEAIPLKGDCFLTRRSGDEYDVIGKQAEPRLRFEIVVG